jgi:hypothetical protein
LTQAFSISSRFLIACAIAFSSCQKPAEQTPAGKPAEHPLAGEQVAQQPAGPQQPAQAQVDAATLGSASGEQLAPLNITLPKPMFVGTPTNIAVPNLESPLGRPRPPFLAPAGTKNLAFQKTVRSSDEEPIIGELSMVTDGDKEAWRSFVNLDPTQDVRSTSGKTIYAVVVWHTDKRWCITMSSSGCG